jgi:hypothetical protein
MTRRVASRSGGWAAAGRAAPGRVGKNPGFKKNQPSGVFFGFLGVFGFIWVFYILAQKREFLGFFQFQEYF